MTTEQAELLLEIITRRATLIEDRNALTSEFVELEHRRIAQLCGQLMNSTLDQMQSQQKPHAHSSKEH